VRVGCHRFVRFFRRHRADARDTVPDEVAVRGGGDHQPVTQPAEAERQLAEVQRRYPEAELRGLSIPMSTGELIRIRARQPHEWLPNGRTLFWVDPADGRFVDSLDARSLPLAARAFNIVYPIHASTVGGLIYKAAMTVAGLALTLMGTLAVYGFWRHRVNPGRPLPRDVRNVRGHA